MPIDFGQTGNDYVAYRVPFAQRLFDRLREFGVGMADQSILDIGSGTGLLASGLTECKLTVLDASPALLSNSSQRRRVAAHAEAIPFDEQIFDVVTAAQCWHWFDRHAAPREILRVLRDDGTLAVIYQTYIPLPGSVAEATEKLILEHRPGWRHANSTGINGQVLRDVQIAGFDRIESFSFDVPVRFARDHWLGFIRTTSPIGASMTPGQIAEFDRAHALMLSGWPSELDVPHRVFVALARKPGSPL